MPLAYESVAGEIEVALARQPAAKDEEEDEDNAFMQRKLSY